MARRPILQVQLVVNCGITVDGDRNVVGYRAPGHISVPIGGGGGGGEKRKAEEEDGEGPAVKRVDIGEGGERE